MLYISVTLLHLVILDLYDAYQSIGVGKLRPNTLVIGFKTNWKTCPGEELVDYFYIVQLVFSYFGSKRTFLYENSA